jgi:hypothetical protein
MKLRPTLLLSLLFFCAASIGCWKRDDAPKETHSCTSAHESLREIASAIREKNFEKAKSALNRLYGATDALSRELNPAAAPGAPKQVSKFPDEVQADDLEAAWMTLKDCAIRDVTALAKKSRDASPTPKDSAPYLALFAEPCLIPAFSAKMHLVLSSVEKGLLRLAPEEKAQFAELKAATDEAVEEAHHHASPEMNKAEKLPAFLYLDSELVKTDALRARARRLLARK